MRHRPPRDPTPLLLYEALGRYLKAKNLLGEPYRPFLNSVNVTLGRGCAFEMVKVSVSKRRAPDSTLEDRLYDAATRAIDRKMRKLGWK
jgi:hypothetical protein